MTASGLSSVTEESSHDTHQPWLHILAVNLSVFVFFLYLSQRQLAQLAPRWLRPFAPEEPVLRVARRWSISTLCLHAVCVAGLALALVPVYLLETAAHWFLAVPCFDLVPWFLITLMTIIGHSTKTPKLLFLQYLLVMLRELANFAIFYLSPGYQADAPAVDLYRICRTCLSILGLGVIGNMPLRDPSWDSLDIGSKQLDPNHLLRSPEDNLTLFQFWTMSWVYPLARICQDREIDEKDVWQLPFDFQHSRLYMAFRELRGKLLPRLIEANGLDLSISTVLAIAEKVAEVTNIRLSAKLFAALDQGRPQEGAAWCLVILFLDFARQICKTCSGWYSRKAYERCRGEAFIGLFGKLLTRAVPGSENTEEEPAGNDVAAQPETSWLRRMFSTEPKTARSPSKQSASNAKVVNLVRGDTYEISQRFWEFPRVVSQPIKVVITVYYLIDIMGWSSCVGFALMALFLALNSLLVRHSIKLERQRAGYSDRRAQAVAHFVEASRPLKLNGWTSSWSDRIMKFRDLEMKKRLQISCVGAAISTVSVLGGAMYPLASICLYTLFLGGGLPNHVIWPSLALFSQLESSVKEAFDLIAAYWKASIPVERVNSYMAEPDRDNNSFTTPAGKDIDFLDASFSRPSTDQLVLRGLTFRIPSGLTVIRGKVGSGKSSLLLAILNEMELRHGHVLRPDESMAYAQQLPWIQNKTIRENIIFNQRFEENRYRQVLDACALGPDMAALPDGDKTKLEEGGIGLSGGQKARVALARAIYSQCRILLLDDPLAALDHDTATTIVHRFIRGPLAEGRTIVMVTHRDDLVLRHARQVVDLDQGRSKVVSAAELERELVHPLHADFASEAAQHCKLQIDQHDAAPRGKDVPEEATETGSIPVSVYVRYMGAGGWHLWILLAVFYIISRSCDIARARLLEAWGNHAADTAGLTAMAGWSLPPPGLYPRPWLYVLAGLSGANVLSYLVAQLLLARISISAARGLFKKAIDKVSKASFRYHDTTPTGQLKNRLIADMGMVDGGILSPLESFVFNLIALLMSLFAIMTHQPVLVGILVCVGLLFVHFFRIYVPVSRCLRRMEMRYLTPIIANIGAMQDGLVTIRALRVEAHFQDSHLEAVDDFQKQDHFFWSMAFWLDFRLGTSSALMRAMLILFMVWYGTPASAVGFVLTQTTTAMIAVQQLCEKFAALQLDAVSLERVEALSRIPQEPSGDVVPPKDWPRPCDDIRFESMAFKYAEGLPSVLDNVSFEIPGGSTCAVLGRTGSGKSTIANALLVTQTPAAGSIHIGGVDLATVDRTELRNRVTFIQQDPTLFPGTLRDNIDPEGRFTDQECTNAVHRVLGPEWSLDGQIDAGGKNLSQGQRQLVGIGRAVLRRSGLVILDEATASIDRGTAARVQRILREELSRSTVITIAHRLEAVEDATWCLRLDRGRVVECKPATANELGGSPSSATLVLDG